MPDHTETLAALNHLLKNYDDLIVRVDDLVGKIETRFADQIACKKGCDACCRSLNLFPVEAFALSRAFMRLGKADQERVINTLKNEGEADRENCPLLIDHACALYSARPVICRTHGLPIYIKRDGNGSVDFCPENFKGVKELPPSALIDLETLNTLLTAVNTQFLSMIDADLPDRIPIHQALLLVQEMILE